MSVSSMVMRVFRRGRNSPLEATRDRQRIDVRCVEQEDVPDQRVTDEAWNRSQPVEAAKAAVPVIPAATDAVPINAGPAFLVDYVDAHGVRSERHLQIRCAFRMRQKLFVNAWCWQQRRERPFRVDRINAMVSASGQEIVSPRQFLSNMIIDNTSAETESHNRTMAKATPGLTALLWIGGSEAEYSETEEALLLEFIDRRISLGNSKRDHSWNRNAALAWIYDAAPGRGDCRASLKCLDRKSGEIALLQDFAGRMVLSDGTAGVARAARRDDLLKWLSSEDKAARQNKRR